MPTRLYSDGTEIDTNDRLAISGGGLVLTATGMLLDEQALLAFNDGPGFYTTTPDKNIHIETDGEVTSAANLSRYGLFAISDLLDGEQQCRGAYFIVVYLNKDGLGNKTITLLEWVDGSLKAIRDDSFDFEGTHYWHKSEIDWTAQTFTVTFYTNALRTITAFTPKVIPLTNERPMQYVYGQQAHNAGAAGGGVSGFNQNFNQITPAIGVTSAYYRRLIENNRRGR